MDPMIFLYKLYRKEVNRMGFFDRFKMALQSSAWSQDQTELWWEKSLYRWSKLLFDGLLDHVE